jgi:hypothetical protein
MAGFHEHRSSFPLCPCGAPSPSRAAASCCVCPLARGYPQWATAVQESPVLMLLFEQTGGVGSENFGDFVAHAAEDLELLFFVAGGVGGIVEAPVVTIHLAGK